MFLKRSLVLAFGVLLFLVGYIVYFEWNDAKMENAFRQQRLAFGVADGVVLTTSSPPELLQPATVAPSAASTAAPIAPVPPVDSSDTTPVPTSLPTPANSATPPASTNTDTNIIIGPVPPADIATPPSTPSDSGPMAPPSSTMLYPGVKHLALLMLAGTTPLQGMQVQTQTTMPVPAVAPAPAPPVSAPVTPTPASAPPPAIAAPATNVAPAPAVAGQAAPPRAVAVEASVIVLLYHQFIPPGAPISPKFQWTLNQDVFASEMKYLHDNNYHVIPMSDLLRFLRHEIGLPPNSVVITIDDGYKSAIVYGAPILKQYGYPWTFFVYPDFITVAEGKGAASWNDLLALQADGVDIECHSMTHPQLTKHKQKIKGVWHELSPAEYDAWLTNETAGAKAVLEQHLGKKITSFAYPYGDHNAQVKAKVVAAGYEAIFTVDGAPVHSSTDIQNIGRYTITRAETRNFVSDLHQGALGLSSVDPAPGAIISDPRPVITAVLGYPGNLDPKSIEAEVASFGLVRHDFDPKTSTVRLYLPTNLIQPVNLVRIRVKDADTGQLVVASWRFTYQPAATGAAVHPPLGTPPAATNTAPAAPVPSSTNQPPVPLNSPGTR